MDPNEPGKTRQQLREESRRAAKPPGQARSKPLTKTDLWRARGEKRLAQQQFERQEYELTLPSLQEVTAKRLPLSALWMMEQIPNALLPIIREWMEPWRQFPDDTDADMEARAGAFGDFIVNRKPDYMSIVKMVFLQCVKDPVFVEAVDPETGQTIVVLESDPELPAVDEYDLLFVFEWAQGVTEAAKAWFQSKQEADLSPGETLPEVRDPASDVLGNPADAGPLASAPVERSGRNLDDSSRRSSGDGTTGAIRAVPSTDETDEGL